jgi:hypothetical protein
MGGTGAEAEGETLDVMGLGCALGGGGGGVKFDLGGIVGYDLGGMYTGLGENWEYVLGCMFGVGIDLGGMVVL